MEGKSVKLHSRLPESGGVWIPVWVDSKKLAPDFAMTRCTYFTLERDQSGEPGAPQEETGWGLELGSWLIPFGLQSLSGVIAGPLEGGEGFASAEQIDRTFDLIEEHPELMVDSGDLWLPNHLPDQCRPGGKVFRLAWDLFSLACAYEAGLIPQEEFQAWCRDKAGAIRHSVSEEEAFSAWQELHISAAREIYPKDAALALKYRPTDAGE